ncbi:LamG-like jellyroll fold domain-containing protein [Patescibacteria group bacterium]
MSKKLLIIPIIIIIAVSAVLILRNQPKQAKTTIREGLFAYWSMDQNDINGTTVYDKSGNDRHGTAIGFTSTPTSTQGKIAETLDFDGTNGYIDAGNILYLGDTDLSATVIFWAKGTGRVISTERSATQTGDATISVNSAENRLYYTVDFLPGSPYVYHVSSTLEADTSEWNMYAISIDGPSNSYIFMLNGEFETITSDFANGQTAYSNIEIGRKRNFNYSTTFFEGQIDELRIYDRVLSENEMAYLYKASKTTHTNAPMRASASGTLVGYWTLDQNDINGTTVFDRSGQGNHGTATGFTSTPTSTTGKINQALDFDGSNGYIEIPNSDSINFTKNFTISFWTKPASTTLGQGFVNKYTGAADKQYGISSWPNGEYKFNYEQNNNYLIGCGSVLYDEWHHIVGTIDSSLNIKCYRNGELIDEDTAPAETIATAEPISIGRNGGTYDNSYVSGPIDEVKIWNYALTAEEVANEYKSGKRKFTGAFPRNGLVGYWNMDQHNINGTTVYDKSDQKNHGTATGFTSTPTSTQGKIAQTLDFDGSNGYVDINDVSYYSSIDTGTLNVWFRAPEDNSKGLFSVSETTDDDEFLSFSVGSALTGTCDNERLVHVSNKNGTTLICCVEDGINYNDGKWHMMTYQKDGTAKPVIYLDGTLKSLTATAACVEARWSLSTFFDVGTAENAVAIGRLLKSDAEVYFNGAIDEVMVWNRMLSADEIAQLYEYKREYRQ